LGVDETGAGAWRAGSALCEEAVEMAKKINDPQLLASALLACAEALLESGQAQRALEMALQAQQSFARFEQQESLWRAWLMAARAARWLGQKSAADEYTSYAAARLSDLEQRWGPETFNRYGSRWDVRYFLSQLD